MQLNHILYTLMTPHLMNTRTNTNEKAHEDRLGERATQASGQPLPVLFSPQASHSALSKLGAL